MSSEIFEGKRREIPTGKGRELSEALGERLLLFGEVKNKVAFVNPGFIDPEKKLNLPFKLEEGKESPMGLFAKATIPKEFQRQPGEQRLETWPEHHRSAILGRVILKDREGRLYRDIDLKGIGFIVAGNIKRPGESRGGTMEYSGFLENNDAFGAHRVQEEFLKEGIRAARTIAIINLEELVVEGEKISLEEARKREIIKEGFQPVVEVRAFGTKSRISDIFFTLGKESKNLRLDDAKKLVSQEIGKDLSDNRGYLEWFAETLGRNLGMLHKKGWFHGGIHKHNVTLDCRFVDVDTAIKINKSDEDTESRYQRDRDMHDAASSLENLVNSLGLKDEIYIFSKQFYQSYHTVFPDK